jgi:hypothetical protein
MTGQQLASEAEHRARVQMDQQVATVTLTRRGKHNALDVAMFHAILAAAEWVAAEPGIWAVVLHGEGESFCSGLDVTSVMSGQAGVEGADSELTSPVPNRVQRVGHDWVRLPVPVIAAIHGNDVPPALAEQARSRSRDQSDTPGHAPWPLDAWPPVPTRFVLCTGDRFFPPEFMRRVVADRLGVVPDEIAAGHAVALSRPKELAELLVSYCATAG